jgi:hypothetical protein
MLMETTRKPLNYLMVGFWQEYQYCMSEMASAAEIGGEKDWCLRWAHAITPNTATSNL